MKKQTIAIGLLIAAASAAQLAAAPTRFVGVISQVEQNGVKTIQITSRGAETKTVHADEKTAYMKWITHKPWQQDASLDQRALVQGRCISVELRADATDIAKTVHISDEPAGSIFDPCKDRR